MKLLKIECKMKTIMFGLIVAVASIGLALTYPCKKCQGRKIVYEKRECQTCCGKGYHVDRFGMWSSVCVRCSKGGIKAQYINIDGKQRKVGPGVIEVQVECPECNGTGKRKSQAVEASNNLQNENEQASIEQKVIRIKKSSVRRLLRDGRIESPNLRIILIDDEQDDL